jgi:hypothetical protein
MSSQRQPAESVDDSLQLDRGALAFPQLQGNTSQTTAGQNRQLLEGEVDCPSVRDIIYPKSPNLLSRSRTCELVFRKGNANEISCPRRVEDRTGFERELRRFRL